jgi:hypothetical protein
MFDSYLLGKHMLSSQLKIVLRLVALVSVLFSGAILACNSDHHSHSTAISHHVESDFADEKQSFYSSTEKNSNSQPPGEQHIESRASHSTHQSDQDCDCCDGGSNESCDDCPTQCISVISSVFIEISLSSPHANKSLFSILKYIAPNVPLFKLPPILS